MKYRIKQRIIKKIKIVENEDGHKYSKLEAKTEYYAQKKVLWWWWRTIKVDKFDKFGNYKLRIYFQYKNDCGEFIKQYHYLHYGMGVKYEIID